MSEEAFLSRLSEKRLKWVEANRENDFEEGIQRLLTDLYPDTAHFIFELLQNAEDAEASKIVFDLKKDKLIVSHNGKRLFNNKDVESITSIGVSTKKDDINQIGKFGVGFKAVFSYTKTPRIYSGAFSFEIRDMVCPHQVSNVLNDSSETRFEFPFNHNKKTASAAFDETAKGLKGLKDNILLFLNNIEQIEWIIEDEGSGFVTRLAHSDTHIEIDHKSVTGRRTNSHWLRFIKHTNPNSRLFVAAAMKLEFKGDIKNKLFDDKISIAKQMQLMPIDGQLSIFFPAEKETTKLKFHIHGPFSSTVARDSIFYNKDNKQLLQHISISLAESLHEIKKIGLLTTDFLAVLPNDADELTEFYKPIQEAVINEMKKSPLVPTHSKGFAPAQKLYHGPAAIREVISDDDLRFLSYTDQVKWAVGVMQNSRQEKFMKTLGIYDWNWSDLVEAIEYEFDSADDDALQWLSQKTDTWMQKLYVLLRRTLDMDEIDFLQLRQCEIVRLESGEHVYGNGVYFPDLTDKESKDISSLPRVKAEILKGKKEQTEKVRQFLEHMGVKDVGEKEEIQHILKTYYSDHSPKIPSNNQHIQHIKRFINWWLEHKENIFSNYKIFFSESGEYLCKPSGYYIDAPYTETGLKKFFSTDGDNKKYCLWHGYEIKKIKNFEIFATSIGVMEGLEIEKQEIPWDHPDRAMLMRHDGGNWSSYRIDEDYTIESIDKLIKKPKTEGSYLIWRCICKSDPETLHARFRVNSRYPITSAPSSLAYILKKSAWIPDKKGIFHKPCDITKSMLHKDFPYDDRNGWLTAIGFGEDEWQKSEEQKNFREVCKKKGLSEECVDFFDEIAKLPKDKQKEKMKEFKKQLYESKLKSSFPEKESDDPERRASKIKEKLADAPEKEYEVRERSVRTTSNEIKPEVKIYLLHNYTNGDGEMLCQICENEMPFKLDDGSHYFEAVEFIKEFPKECRENFLALCPVCAAKYKYANASKPEDIRSALMNADNGNLSIPVTLAREPKTIRFVQIHLNDLRALIQNEK